MNTRTRIDSVRLAVAGLATAAAAIAVPAAVSAAPGDAAEQDPANSAIAEVFCEPEGSILRPTSVCSVYDPETELSTNPYTEDGQSPGILGLGVLGIF